MENKTFTEFSEPKATTHFTSFASRNITESHSNREQIA